MPNLRTQGLAFHRTDGRRVLLRSAVSPCWWMIGLSARTVEIMRGLSLRAFGAVFAVRADSVSPSFRADGKQAGVNDLTFRDWSLVSINLKGFDDSLCRRCGRRRR